MNEYLGVKHVKAEPMSANDALAAGYRIGDHKGEDGYVVEYEDGYKSWSPKEVFIKAYKPFDSKETKLLSEYDFAVFNNNCFDSSVVGKGKQKTVSEFYRDLHKHFLIEYMQAVCDRRSSDIYKEKIFNMCNKSFDFALFALKFGLPIKRDCWDANLVFMQIPAKIDNKDVEKMKSIPKEVKRCIENSYMGIQYISQCIFYNTENSLATYWAPTIDDIMANDWEIVESEL
jgi:hypothetical protein